jgi:ParB family transcriptional regulator, chromosome partitioning protein
MSVQRSGQYQRLVPLVSLRHSTSNPRARFDDKSLGRLAESLNADGVLDPLIVRPHFENGREVYEIVCGERRFRAAKLAGLFELPVVVLVLSDNEARRLALIEQLEREHLTDLEIIEATSALLEFELHLDSEGVRKLLNKMHAVQQKHGSLERILNGTEAGALLAEQAEAVLHIFARVGRGTWRNFLTNALPLLQLPEDVLEALRSDTLPSKTAAKLLARVPSTEQRVDLMLRSREGRWSTRRLEREINRLFGLGESAQRLSERLRAVAKHLEQYPHSWTEIKVRRLIADLEVEIVGSASNGDDIPPLLEGTASPQREPHPSCHPSLEHFTRSSHPNATA